MTGDKIEIQDLEAFIDGLITSFDTLGDIEPGKAKGFQAQLAKAISDLRTKRAAKIEPLPKHIGPVDLKELLLKELEAIHDQLDAGDYNPRNKFKLVKKIALIREQANSL
ncbi:MAG: hypothetical protein ACW972_00780 [Promethearchaeota archaeon]|jgi:hypothetical protein